MLAKKISGTLVGLWLLAAEHLRLGSWELLKGWSGNNEFDMRLGMQVINEAALCVNGGIRPRNNLCHQGFEILNGLCHIATDKQIHLLLDKHTVKESGELQIVLAKIRKVQGDYKGRILAIDPHRIESSTERIMPRKKNKTEDKSKKILQTFFCVDAETKQPVLFKIGTSAQTVTRATKSLRDMIKEVFPKKLLFIADKEHFAKGLIECFSEDDNYDILMPIALSAKVKELLKTLEYKEQWPGYAIAQSVYKFSAGDLEAKLIGQRFCEKPSEYSYNGFLTTSKNFSLDMLTEEFPKRWTIEEFFNFEGSLGWNRASTMNLNIRYGKMTLSLIAQALVNNLRKLLPSPFQQWTAKHIADSIFSAFDGDIRVKGDTLLVTLYNVPEELNLRKHYEKLPQKLEYENINPKMSWLFDYKLDFRFR